MTFIIAVAACALIIIACITGLAMYALSGEKPHGHHARRPGARDAAPFADPADEDPDRAADEYIAALNAEPEPAPVLAAPVPEMLEPLPFSSLDRRERTVAIAALPAWEPPVDRGTLESIRDALRALPAAPVAAAEPEPEPEPEYDPAGENTQQIFLRVVGGQWDPAAMAAEIEASVCGDIAPEDSGEEKADFAGVSVAGLPDDGWDLSAPVALTGKHHRAAGNGAAA